MSDSIPSYEIDPTALASLIRTRANRLFSGHLPAISNVSVSLPTAEQFQTAWQSEGLLAMERGTIRIESEGGLPPLQLRAPMPFHGIFVLQGRVKEAMGESDRNTLWSWCPWLAEVGGIRLYRGNTDRNEVNLRIGTGGGNYVDVPMIDGYGNAPGGHDEYWSAWCRENFSRRSTLIQSPESFPSELRASLKTPPILPPFQKSEQRLPALWTAIRDYIKPLLSQSSIPTDLDDLNYRFLMTYPHWLASRIVEGIWREAFRQKKESKRISPTKRWQDLVEGEAPRAIEASLFPKKNLLKTGKLHAFRPTNPVDAISQLTQVKRYDVGPDVIDHLPAAYHQNHPSFAGRICPVETPESESLGISLHLAKGATLDANGRIIPCPDSVHGLGWAASLVPLFEHNDAVRNMMGAKNLKQGVPVAARHCPAIATTEEDEVLQVLAPLLKQGVIPNAIDPSGRLALGVDLLVAYMPFLGLNFEDAIVANRRLVDEGVLDFLREETFSSRIKPGYAGFKEHNNVLRVTDDHLDEHSLAKPGTTLTRGMILVSLWHPKSGTEHHIRYQDMESSELLSIKLDYDPCFGGRLTYRIRKKFPLGPGDKLMGRHGNKGVISAFLPPEEMPRLPDCEALPPNLRGRAVDLVLNPHGVVSRMNLGQLMETHLGWLLHTLPANKRGEFQFDCKAFAQQYPRHADRISSALKETGLDASGKVQLLLPNGETTQQPVVVGFQHIVRLRHIPALKSQSRGHNAKSRYDARTGQAVHGRRSGGGQRVGEMELWALSGHQADSIISEMLYAKSDTKAFNHAAPVLGASSTWEALQDHLFAVGIAAEVRNGQVRFGWAPLNNDKWSSGIITGREDFIPGMRSVFQCERCDYRPMELAAFRSVPDTTLKEFLQTLGWLCPNKPTNWLPAGDNDKGQSVFKGQWQLQDLNSSRTVMADVECTERKNGVIIRMRYRATEDGHDIEITASGRNPSLDGTNSRKSRRQFTATGIGCTSSAKGLRPIGELQVHRPTDETLFQKMGDQYVELHQVLKALGWLCPDKPIKWTATGKNKKGFPVFQGQWLLRAIHSSRTVPAEVECTDGKSWVGIRMRFLVGKEKEEIVLTAMGRNPGQGGTKAKQTKQGFTPDGLARVTDDTNLLPIGRLHVTCSAEHPSMDLRPMEGMSVASLHPVQAGLFCPNVFGTDPNEDRRWGCIQLPVEIPFPNSSFLGKVGYPARNKDRFTPPPGLRYVPVLPPKYRAFNPDIRDLTELQDINKEYRRLIDLCLDTPPWDKLDESARNKKLKALNKAVERVFECGLSILSGKVPKAGLLRRHGLGRRVDCSGRLVIIPDPKRSPSECQVPVPILWDLVSSDVVQWLKEAETFFSEKHSGRIALSKAFAEAEKLSKHALQDTDNLYDRRWDILQKKLLDFRTAADLRARTVTEGASEDLCLRTLEAFLKAHPNKLLILNRQPSLHKYSMLAFRPVPSRMSEGEVLRISPLVCGLLNADFDGDEMALHWPLSDDAHREARRLLFRYNLMSEANGSPQAHFAQDVVLGLYLQKKRGQESALYSLLPDRDRSDKCCQAVLRDYAEWGQEAGIALLGHICTRHTRGRDVETALQKLEADLKNLFELTFRSATTSGNSFGYFDLHTPPAADIEAAVRPLDMMDDPNALSTADTALANATKRHLKQAAQSTVETPGYGLATMIVSGARKADQASQLLAMRGRLGEGAIGFDADPREFFFQHSLSAGCDRKTYFRTVYNGRSSMCDKKLGTGKAGWLTRELVGGLWQEVVVAGDCGATGPRSPATCKLTHGICQHCYGPAISNVTDYVDPDTGFYRAGYPAGLIAAQSIGERGTQLSMQSFHTAKRAFTPNSVRKLLNTPELFDFTAFAVDASEWDKEAKEAFADLSKAFYEVVPELPSLQAGRAISSGSDKAQVTIAIKKLVESRLADPALVDKIDSIYFKTFLATFRSIKAYSAISERHLALLWRMIYRSPGKKLVRLTNSLPPMAALGFRPIRKTLYGLAAEAEIDPLNHPAARIMLGCYRAETH